MQVNNTIFFYSDGLSEVGVQCFPRKASASFLIIFQLFIKNYT